MPFRPPPAWTALVCFALAAFASIAAAYQPINPKIDPVARRVFDYIGAAQGNFIISGQYEDTLNMKAEHLDSPLLTKYTKAQMNTVQRITGKLPAIRGFDIRAELGAVENDPVIEEILTSWRDNRQIITICWHAGAPPLEDTYPNSVKKTYGLIPLLLTSGTPENIAFLQKLDLIAAKLQRLRDAGVPVLWRPYHEISGGWFWWSQGTTVDIKDLWKFTYKYLTEKKQLHNLIWVWSSPDYAEKECYPGHAFVDIAACDIYPRYQQPLSRWSGVYAQLVEITQGTKPIALSENDIIPSPNDMFDPSSTTRFSWFATWRAPWLTYNSDANLQKIYNHEKVVTADELPDFVGPPEVVIKLPGQVLREGEQVLLASRRTTWGETATFQWYEGETGDVSRPIPGATASSFLTPALSAPASYWLRVTHLSGIHSSNTIRLTPAKASGSGQPRRTVRKITSEGLVTPASWADDAAAPAYIPYDIAVDSSGNIFVADREGHVIRKITSRGTASLLAGAPGAPGSADGESSAARFNRPSGIAVDGDGNVYVTDAGNHTIRRITSAGVVTTLAGKAGTPGTDDGSGESARFNRPSGLAVDGKGTVYVADTGSHTIRRITSAGAVTTLAGNTDGRGSIDGTGSAARFYNPRGIAVDGSGNLYVADQSNHTIRKITPLGVVTTLAGRPSYNGAKDDTGIAAQFDNPSGVAVDRSGNVYVADQSAHTIRKITAAGVVTTLAGTAYSAGGIDAVGGAARFFAPSGVAVDAAGNLYVADASYRAAANTPPVAAFTATPNPVIVGGTIELDGSTSGDLDAGDTIVSYAWDLGDGVFGTPRSSPKLSLPVPAPTERIVRLRVTDSRGAAGVASLNVSTLKNAQTITFAPVADKTYGDAPFALSATTSSGLQPSFTVDGPAVVTGNMLKLTGAGAVTVRVSQSGDAVFLAAPDVIQTFSVARANQTIAFVPLANKTYGDAPLVLSATTSSGLSPTFSIDGPATLTGNTLRLTGTGVVTVRVSQTGDALFLAAPDVVQTFSVAKAGQTIAFTPLANKVYRDAPFTLSATASSGLVPSFAVDGPATLSGNTLTITGAGLVTVRASQSGNALFLAAPEVIQTFSIAKAAQTISAAPIPDQTYGNAPFNLSASTTSGLSPSFSVFGPALLEGNTLTITGTGLVTIRISQGGNGAFLAAPDVVQTFSVAKAGQTIAFAALANKTYGDAPITLGATTSSGLAPSFTVEGPATLSGKTLTFTSAGVVTVRASQSGSELFLPASDVIQAFSVAKAAQTISFAPVANKTWGDAPFAIGATATSGLAPGFTVSGPATLSGNTLTLTGTGVVTLRASQPGGGAFLPAADVVQTFSVAKAPQTILFASVANRTYGDEAFIVSATASSGLSPSFSVEGPATLTGNTLRLTGTGAVTVRASQSGNDFFLAAPEVVQTFGVAKASQTISFAPIANKTYGDAPLVLSATASSGLSPTFTVDGPATLTGNMLRLTGTGIVTVRVSQTGDALFFPAPDVVQTFSVAKAGQTIAFAPLANKAYRDAPFTLNATASSGLAPSFAVEGPATLSGNTLTITGAGLVTVRASQGGNALFLAAPEVVQTFSITKAAQTIAFAPIANRTYGDAPFSLNVTTSSGLNPSFSVYGPVTLEGGALTLTGAGLVTIRASQEGNAVFLAAPDVIQTFAVAKAGQTLAFAPLANKTYGDAPITLGATSSSGLSATFTVEGPATLTGNSLQFTAAGVVTVRASQSGNDRFLAASDVIQTFSVAKAAQTISFAPVANKTWGDAPFVIGATATSGLAPVFTVSGPATLSGNTLTLTGTGVVTLRASQAGNGAFLSAADVVQTFSVAKAAQTIAFASLANRTYSDDAVLLGATASSGLNPSFTVEGPASLTGNILRLTGAGTVTIRASQSGNALFLAASDVTRTFSVAKASQTITVAPVPNKTFGDAPVLLSATTTSGLTPSLTVSGPATLSGNTLTLTAAGVVTIRAAQPGNDAFLAAPDVVQTFTVAQAAQTISFAPVSGKTYGAAPFAVSATASSSLHVTLAVASGPATVSGNTVTITGAGTVTLRATQAGSTDFAAASPVLRSFVVGKATLTARVTDKSRLVGQANPAFPIVYSGFVGNDVPAMIDAPPVARTTAVVSSPAGSYPITLTGGIDENYLFASQEGLLTVVGVPAISVSGSGKVIASGSTSPRADNGTDFSLTPLDGSGVRRTFKIKSTGSAPLKLSGVPRIRISGPNAADFTATPPSSDLLAIGEEALFEVRFLPLETGLRQAVVSVESDAPGASPYSFSVQGEGLTAIGTHAVIGVGYIPGGTLKIRNSFTFSESVVELKWQVLLPAGMSFLRDRGDAAQSAPTVGDTGLLEWRWTTIPADPNAFTYTVRVGSDVSDTQLISTMAVAVLPDGTEKRILVQPEPLAVTAAPTHAADTDQNYNIDLLELTRVIELYNVRQGTVRTGRYLVDDVTEDGFDIDPTGTKSAGRGRFGRYHSADINRDGQISSLELTRVLQLYNTFNGTNRTGAYHVAEATEDGFAPSL